MLDEFTNALYNRHSLGDNNVFLVNTTGWIDWDDVSVLTFCMCTFFSYTDTCTQVYHEYELNVIFP